MSAFICNNTHITALAVYAHKAKLSNLSPSEIGQLLHAENVRSVNHRYGEHTAPHFHIDGQAAFAKFSPVQIIKAAHCLEYQSCEHDEYEDSAARRIIEATIAEARKAFPATCAEYSDHDLPGYAVAAWEIAPGSYKLTA